jgi:hypothetical protein
MIKDIVIYINNQIAKTGYTQVNYGLVDVVGIDGITMPRKYIGGGEYKAINNVDSYTGISYMRKVSNPSISNNTTLSSQSCTKWKDVSIPLRLVVIARNDESTCDDEFRGERAAATLLKVISENNFTLKNTLKAKKISINATSQSTDSRVIYRNEFGAKEEMPYGFYAVQLDISVLITISAACIMGECEEIDECENLWNALSDKDRYECILRKYDFSSDIVVSNLTEQQVSDIIAEFCNGTQPIDISINGVLVAEQVTENQNIPVTQGGEPVGSWDGEKWVVPECAPCADATVNVNNTLYDTVESGNTLDIEVRKSTGNDLIGSKQGQYWRVGDSSINVNGDNLTDVKATETINITVVDSADSPVAVTLSGGNKITVPSLPCGAGLNTANATKTGSITSYRTGDSAATNRGRLDTFGVLDFMNPFGNNQRFTGITGGYNVGANWFDKDGNATTEALAIPEDVVLDWAQWNSVGNTVLGIYRVPVTGNWDACVDACLAVATTTFPTGWAIINFVELAMIRFNDGLNGGINYRPFSISIIGVSTRIYAGDTNPNTTTAAYTLNEAGALGSTGKTSSARSLAARVITLAELGL